MGDSREAAITSAHQVHGAHRVRHGLISEMFDVAVADGHIHYTDALAARLEAEIRPLIATTYDCCGCSTYGKILDHAIRIVRGEADDG